MFFCYDDNPSKKHYGAPVPYDELDASSFYIRHYNNMLYLNFIAKNSDDVSEKRQANHELEIAQRKMKHWERHPNFNQSHVMKQIEILKKEWR